MSLRSEKTRSAAAELGVNDPTICIARAHVGKTLPLFFQNILGEFCNVLVVEGSAGALGEVGRQLLLEAGNVLHEWRDRSESVDQGQVDVLRGERRVEGLDQAVDLEQLGAIVVGLAVACEPVAE
eukprot:5587994-Prymnesium_polylepis.1